MGTKLGEIAYADLTVEFNYGQPVKAGTVVKGLFSIRKRNNPTEPIFRALECVRYLKSAK